MGRPWQTITDRSPDQEMLSIIFTGGFLRRRYVHLHLTSTEGLYRLVKSHGTQTIRSELRGENELPTAFSR